MKRLYQINKPNGDPYTVADGNSKRVLYFSDKIAAKAERNALNSGLPKPAGHTAEQNYAAKILYTVGYGIDHHNYKGV